MSKDKKEQSGSRAGSRRNRHGAHYGNYTVGRTIADTKRFREKDAAEEREAALASRKRRSVFVWLSIALILVAGGIIVFSLVSDFNERRRIERLAEEQRAVTPTVKIVDENAGVEVSRRVNLFVVGLEEDVAEQGLVIDRVVLPFQKARQLHYLIKIHLNMVSIIYLKLYFFK